MPDAHYIFLVVLPTRGASLDELELEPETFRHSGKMYFYPQASRHSIALCWVLDRPMSFDEHS
jgi:hypothetical protein